MTPTDYLFIAPALAVLAYSVRQFLYHRKQSRINLAFRQYITRTYGA